VALTYEDISRGEKMEKKYYEVKQHDSNKLRAVVTLLEQHATYKNLSLQQIEALKDVINFIKELPKELDAAQPVVPVVPELTIEEVKKKAKALGYVLSKMEKE
jgi:glutamate formiminotransferase